MSGVRKATCVGERPWRFFFVSLAVSVSSVDMKALFDRVRNLIVHGSFVAPTDCV